MRTFLFLFAFSLNLFVSAQLRFDYPIKDLDKVEFLVTYSLNFCEDSLKPDVIRKQDMLLFIGKSISYFTSHNMYVADTMMKQVKNVEQFQAILSNPNRAIPLVRFRYKIYKNYPDEKLSFIEHIPSTTFKYEEDLSVFNWQLTTDTSSILGYKAQKATCDFGGRSWVAWFSSEIPFSDGPYKFNGLPGLIMKVFDTRNHYVFEIMSIEKPEKELMIEFVEKEYLDTSKQGFFKAEDGFRDDIISRAKDAGISSESQQTAARNLAKQNNTIELHRK